MTRRLAALATLLAALTLGGCAYGTAARLTSAQQHARIAFIDAHRGFSDRDLARLCPGLYPADFLTNAKKWPAGKATKGEKPKRVTAQDRAEAKAAGCDVRPG